MVEAAAPASQLGPAVFTDCGFGNYIAGMLENVGGCCAGSDPTAAAALPGCRIPDTLSILALALGFPNTGAAIRESIAQSVLKHTA